MMDPTNRNLSHRRAIYLDFEGEGVRQGTADIPPPHMAGTYVTDPSKTVGGRYSVTVFKATWQPVKNGCREVTSITSIKDFLWQLIELSISEGRTIYYWTQHELAVVESLKDEKLKKAFKEVSFNIKPLAKRLVNRRRLRLADHSDKALNNFLKTLCPNSQQVAEIRPGAAESCRRLDNYSGKAKRWSRWTVQQKSLAKSLIQYNREDCLGLYQLTKRSLMAASDSEIEAPNGSA